MVVGIQSRTLGQDLGFDFLQIQTQLHGAMKCIHTADGLDQASDEWAEGTQSELGIGVDPRGFRKAKSKEDMLSPSDR